MKQIIFLSIIFMLFSCKKEDIYSSSLIGAGQIEIISFQKPDTILNYSQSKIQAKAMAWDGCYYDLVFDYDSLNTFEYSLKAFAKFSNLSGKCPQIVVTKDTIINFQPAESGIYIFHIYSSWDKIVTDSIIVI